MSAFMHKCIFMHVLTHVYTLINTHSLMYAVAHTHICMPVKVERQSLNVSFFAVARTTSKH